MTKHIAIDARLINTSTGTYMEKLLDNLQTIDTENRYTVIVPTKDRDFWKPTNTNFSIVTGDFKDFSLAEQTSFKRFLDNINADLVHFCMPEQPVLYTGKKVTTIHDLNLLRARNTDKKQIVFRFKQFVGQFVFRSVAQTSRFIITPTQYVKNDVVQTLRVASEKVVVTSEAADPKEISALKPYDHPYKQFIMYVGRQVDYKNIKRLGDAHQILLEKHPDLGLILVGSLNEAAQRNKAYFKKKGYKNITFTGFIPDEERDWLFKQAEAYVFPSLMEGFGLPGLEAMGYGTPVISSNTTCLPEVYGDAAHYFDPNSTDDMARAIDEVLTDETLRKSLIEKGERQLQKYSWEDVAKKTLEVYRLALGK
jgi:glycosyltransferase involved in cell wall biosynthesis